MFRQYRLFTRLLRYYKVYLPNRSQNIRKFIQISRVDLLLGTTVFCVPKMVENYESQAKLEDDINRALQEGEAATLRLMTQLKDFVVVTSEEYRRCITRQIEIMRKATVQQAGPYSAAYDELPQYRTLANELKKELVDYYTLFNTLVNMANKENSQRLVNHSKSGEQLTEFEALQHVVEQEIEKNSACEKELLQAVTDNIINEILFDTPD